MVTSLKQQFTKRLDLMIGKITLPGDGRRLTYALGSREFLRLFTDAAMHVPRHRRTQYVNARLYSDPILNLTIFSFFTHLTDVLGPKAFLTPVILLLVNRSANRVVRQEPGESLQHLSLPLALLARASHEARLSV